MEDRPSKKNRHKRELLFAQSDLTDPVDGVSIRMQIPVAVTLALWGERDEERKGQAKYVDA
jgi:hypothetical protein